MKRFLLVFGLIGAIAAAGFAANAEDLEIYTYLYEATNSPSEKYNILQALQPLKLTGAGDFYARAFSSLVDQIPTIQRTGTAAERVAADDLAQALASLIGEEKHSSGAPDLWRAYNAFTAPLVKAEALVSLGKLQAVEFLPQVVRALQDNAVAPTGSDEVDSKSHIVRGAILALEKYRDVSGYLPVFRISVSGYPDRIKRLARDALPNILEDPSELLTEQVIKSASFAPSDKLVALQTLDEAKVPDASKAAAAVAALSEGWRASTNDPRQRGAITDLRKTGIRMIGRYGTNDAAAYSLLERSYRDSGDTDEKLAAIAALEAMATEDSAKLLNDLLNLLAQRMGNGAIGRDDQTMVRALIPALAATKSPVGRQALSLIAAQDWTPAIKALANDALAKLPAQ